MSLSLINDNVIAKKLRPLAAHVGLIEIPETADAPYFKYKVMAAGPGKKNKKGIRIPMDVKTGDTIFAAKFNGTEIRIDGHIYYLLNSTQILGVLDEDEE
jgi:chaperonin GroES